MNGRWLSFERGAVLTAAALGVVNVFVALFCLPSSPGFDDRTLFGAIYAYQHYGRLFYPFYDLPFMYIHPPAKYFAVASLVRWGVPLRTATGGLLMGTYLLAVAGVFAARFTTFQRLAALFAITATVTLCPFVAYHPENLTHGEIIGRIRPEDLVLTLWFAGLIWLEAARRDEWRESWLVLGGFCIGLGATMHYFGAAALGAAGTYGLLILMQPSPLRARRVGALALGVGLALLPTAAALAPYVRQVSAIVLSQGGESSGKGLVVVWHRHMADLWFLLQWAKRHAGNVWPAAALLAIPVRISVPPLVLAVAALAAFRSSRAMAAAGFWLPLAVLLAAHKWIGYELPEVALFLLACGWIAAEFLDRLKASAPRRLAAAVLVLPLATASPLIWDSGALRFMDRGYDPELLRAIGRSLIGPGKTVLGAFYTPGEDRFVLQASPDDPAIDFVLEREFHLDAAALHDRYLSGRLQVAGFILTPGASSASTVYYSNRKGGLASLGGFVADGSRIRRFSTDGSGWRFKMLSCAARPADRPWVSPQPPTVIAGYIPRTNDCAAETLAGLGLGGRFSSAFLRRTFPNGDIGDRALVPLLISREADAAAATGLRARCGCESVQEVDGSLQDVSAASLFAELARTDRVVEFYSTTVDMSAGRSMAVRFGATRPR